MITTTDVAWSLTDVTHLLMLYFPCKLTSSWRVLYKSYLLISEEALTEDCKAEMATMVTLLMGNYQLDMTLATACDTDVADHCNIEKNMKREGNVCVLSTYKL